MACPLKCDDSSPEDSQIHLMSCKSICSRLDGKYIEEAKDIKYSDIYSDIHSQNASVRYLSSLLEVRRIILEELQTSTVSTSGPSLDTRPARGAVGTSYVNQYPYVNYIITPCVPCVTYHVSPPPHATVFSKSRIRETLNLPMCADSSTDTKTDKNGQKGKKKKKIMCQVSCVTCHLSPVTCH